MTRPNLSVDWPSMTKELAEVFRGQLNGVLAGSAEDLNRFAIDMTNDMTRAIREGRPELADEVRAQAKGLVELNRLRIVNTSNNVLDTVLMVMMRVASIALGNVTGYLGSNPI